MIMSNESEFSEDESQNESDSDCLYEDIQNVPNLVNTGEKVPNYVKTVENYSQKLLDFSHDCYEKELFCDVSVQVESKTFKTHCVVLSMASEYFKVLLQMDNERKDSIPLTVSCVTAELFERILKFAYTGAIDFTDISLDTVLNLAVAADYLGILSLKEFCEEHLSVLVSLENAIELFVSSEIYNMPKLSNVVKTLFRRNYLTLSDTKEFFDIPTNILQVCLKDDFLAVYKREHLVRVPPNHTEREKLIFASVLKYIDRNIQKNNISSKESLDLLKSVKLIEFDLSYLRSELSKFPNLETNADILKLVDLAEACTKLSPHSKNIPEFWKYPRKLEHVFEISPVHHVATTDLLFSGFYQMQRIPEHEHDPLAILKKITLWIFDSYGGIGAMEFIDSNGLSVLLGEPNQQNIKQKHVIELVENEVITEVTTSLSWNIDNLKFKTNLGNEYGPYGDNVDEKQRSVCPSTKIPMYLHSFGGGYYRREGKASTIDELSCRWVGFC